jgi:ribulose-phosphate 3-epimerase
MVLISASLLAAEYACLGAEMQRAVQAGVDSFHFDWMDGHYVPNLALTPNHLRALRPYSQLPFHVHLELGNPDQVLSSFPAFPADMIFVQRDTLPDPAATFDMIRSRGMKVGLALNPDDALENALPFLDRIDDLLILGVYPGFGGQSMQARTLDKVAAARRLLDMQPQRVTITVDGGVKPGNAAGLVQAGADCLIIGTALFQSPDMTEFVRSLREDIAASQRR